MNVLKICITGASGRIAYSLFPGLQGPVWENAGENFRRKGKTCNIWEEMGTVLGKICWKNKGFILG